MDRDAANRRVLQQLRDRADQVQSKIDDGKRTSTAERKFLQRVNRLEDALRKASADAERAGESGPLLLAFDPAEFGGDGRAVLSFGDDPHQADSVSWHAPGIRTTIHSLFGFSARSALNHLQSTRFENPNLKAASIAWIGYDAPSGLGLRHLLRQTAARAGGEMLYSDLRAFNAARDTWAGDGSHFTGNHIFGYSYGSTATAYAGRDGRLATHVSTVSLVGSPGAGPLQHASEFGPGVDVYVASSSRDVVTAQGGRTPGSVSRILEPVGRFFGIGLGVDPAMDSFGAVRVTAEFAAARNLLYTGGTHHAYLLHVDSTADPTTRSESLANLGRISAGRTELLELEQHRTADGRHTVEPAAERASPRRFWNPTWRRVPNCAQRVAEELSAIYGRDIHLDVTPSRRGVPARALFEAVGSDAHFATYSDVAETLQHMPSGSTAVLVSRWSGGGQGGHAYLARNINGEIHFIDPHTGTSSGWPPHWGQDAVARTAVGYLNANGDPVDRVNVDIPLRLDAADAVGRVQGRPADPEFVRRLAEYRAQDPTTRRVDTSYAEPLGDVVDNATDPARLRQFADDLSGQYGPFRVQFKGSELGRGVFIEGDILNGNEKVGRVQLEFDRDKSGNLVAYETGTGIDNALMRGKGFYKALHTELERYYERSGVDRIESGTHFQGSYAAARRGFMWDPTPGRLRESLDRIKNSARRLQDGVSDEARILLEQVIARMDPEHPRLPELVDLASLNTPDEPDLGRRLLEGVQFQLSVVKYLQAHPPSRGFGAWLQSWFGLGGDSPSQTRHDCAHRVVDLLNAMYRRDFHLAIEPSRRGVAARALFEAVGSGSRFATYDDVADELRQLGDGSSAVLASRWADTGRHQAGHAYLARNIGGAIFLIDPFTGERSGWPPYWGEDAVARTAVGYLDSNGNPVHSLHDVPLQLAAAKTIGHVQGHPDDSDFSRRQAEYRAQDPITRRVDTRYAEPLGPVVDSASSAGAGRLAEDFSGVYGPYRVELEGLKRGEAQHFQDDGRPRVVLEGVIFDGDRDVGDIALSLYRDDDGNLVAHHELHTNDENFRGWEFTRAVNSALAPYYAGAGVERIVTTTLGKSAYAAADLGDTWDPDPKHLQESLDHVKAAARRLSPSLSDEGRVVLDQIVQRLEPEHPRLPDPVDLAHLTTFDEPDLGRRLLEGTRLVHVGDGTGLHYLKYLWNARLQSSENCAHWVADVLSDRYGVSVRLDAAPSSTGMPARALFEAAGSRAEFATYTEIAELLFQMSSGRPGQPGPAAIVVSSWAGGQRAGGHAYLAVVDGGQIYLLDPFTGERSGWPPYWGEDAVSRTAVGYLDANGRPVQPVDGSPHELAAADAVGDVQGMDPSTGGTPEPVRALGLPNYEAGTLSDAETRAVYTDGELQIREVNERLVRDGVSTEERAQILSRLRDSLRAWTRDLMSNRVVAEFLAAYERNAAFEDLLAHNEAKGLTGDAAYEAIIHTATHSHYAPGTLSDVETTALYSQFELQMRNYNEQLIRNGVSVDERARILSELRTSLRAWTRDLMSNRAAAALLAANERNPTLEDLIARYEARGFVGDAVYEAIINSATHSHYAAATLSNAETRTVYTTFELRMREVAEHLMREGLGLEERARTLYDLRASLRSWTRALMEDRETAEYLTANEPNPSFEALVERQRKKGLEGDAIFEAIIASATRSRAAVNESLGIDPENPPPLPPMRGPEDPPEGRSTDE
ncbi:toxin glutamine deamidase domain-containing protein [Mycobacterium sp.]|uniref:toxin glutamine deamidase domain-containing protein n=1 Tax=Mycobacterium sp. TaxID=1785 RepID=UPI002D90C09F|nr:toxin glutamine deamidase domain-containing protein [Mycobacterium sp.]